MLTVALIQIVLRDYFVLTSTRANSAPMVLIREKLHVKSPPVAGVTGIMRSAFEVSFWIEKYARQGHVKSFPLRLTQ